MKSEYVLMYENTPVARFDTEKEAVLGIPSPAALPFQIKKMADDPSFSYIRKFCTHRVMLLDRAYSKEILTSAGIDDQNPIEICTTCKGLSFRDNYWIKRDGEDLSWESVNLYKNPFSTVLSRVAVTGESHPVEIGDRIYTGELTGHGTRAKCFFRQDERVFLAKKETPNEILSEVASHEIAELFEVPSATYIFAEVYGHPCSVCAIGTSPQIEMIPARDVLLHFGETRMAFDTEMFLMFEKVGQSGFAKMVFFDYVTLNTDRNRDNLALKRRPFSQADGMFELYDHDSCFKGKTTNAPYFPTGSKFSDSPAYLKDAAKKFPGFSSDAALLCGMITSELPAVLKAYSLEAHADGALERTEAVMKELGISKAMATKALEECPFGLRNTR